MNPVAFEVVHGTSYDVSSNSMNCTSNAKRQIYHEIHRRTTRPIGWTIEGIMKGRYEFCRQSSEMGNRSRNGKYL